MFKVLQDLLGKEVLEKGLQNYIQHPASPRKDIYDFSKGLSEAAGYDVWPILEPWLKSKYVPHVSVRKTKNEIIVEQQGDVFQFQLEVKFIMGSKNVIKKYRIEKKTNAFKVNDIDLTKVDKIEIDPNQQMLLRTK